MPKLATFNLQFVFFSVILKYKCTYDLLTTYKAEAMRINITAKSGRLHGRQFDRQCDRLHGRRCDRQSDRLHGRRCDQQSDRLPIHRYEYRIIACILILIFTCSFFMLSSLTVSYATGSDGRVYVNGNSGIPSHGEDTHESGNSDANADGASDVSANRGADMSADGATDASADGATDASADGASDVSANRGADMSADGATDVSADGASGMSADGSSDASADVRTSSDIKDSLSFHQALPVDSPEKDMSMYPEPSVDSPYDTSDLPDFDCDAYILIDRRSGQTICAKNADTQLYPASTTKIMTGILAIENGDMNDVYTASVRAVRDIGPDGSNIGIIAGEKMRLDNLLDALLVRSANETANIIAENLCDTRSDFIALMNSKARELGALNTNFTNAIGVQDPDHYSTAFDLAKIANYAMNNPRFREIVAKPSIILSPTNKHSSWERMNTTNNLLLDDSIKDYFVTGVKTGFHSEAGYCVVASGKDGNGMELLCVVLGVHGTATGTSKKRFEIASELLKYGFTNFQLCTFIREKDLIGTISVLGGENMDTVDALSEGTVKLFLPKDQEKWNVSKIEYLKSEVNAPVKSGEQVGYIEFRNSGFIAGRVRLVASSDIPAIGGGVRPIQNRGDTGSARSVISRVSAGGVGSGAGGGADRVGSNVGGSAGGNAGGSADGDGVGAARDGGVTASDSGNSGSSAGGAGARSLASVNSYTWATDEISTQKKSPLSNINIIGIVKGLLIVVLSLAVLISLLRTALAIIRRRRKNNRFRQHGKLYYPPVQGKYRRRHPRIRNRKYENNRRRGNGYEYTN